VQVADVAQSTEWAHGRGAFVLLDVSARPDGWGSVIATQPGGEVAFWQPKR
jgi:hypothetical protein